MLRHGDIRLWPLERADLVQNYQWANERELIELAGMIPKPKGAAELERWYETILAAQDIEIFSIKLTDGSYIGNIELRAIDHRSGRAEVGVVIGDRQFWGRGLGRQAIEAMVRYGFQELRLHRLYARILESNPRAKLVFERCGFVHEGTERQAHFSNGKHWNIEILGLIKSEWSPNETDRMEE